MMTAKDETGPFWTTPIGRSIRSRLIRPCPSLHLACREVLLKLSLIVTPMRRAAGAAKCLPFFAANDVLELPDPRQTAVVRNRKHFEEAFLCDMQIAFIG